MALEEGLELMGCLKKKKTSLWQGVTTQGTKGAIITLQRGQKADSALGRRPADFKATFCQC